MKWHSGEDSTPGSYPAQIRRQMGSGNVKRLQATQPTGQGVSGIPAPPYTRSPSQDPDTAPHCFPRRAAFQLFRPPQAVASVTPPWDPGRKSWGDGRRRPTESPRFPHKGRSARIKQNCGCPRNQRAGNRRNPRFLACQHAETRSQPIARAVTNVLISLMRVKDLTLLTIKED